MSTLCNTSYASLALSSCQTFQNPLSIPLKSYFFSSSHFITSNYPSPSPCSPFSSNIFSPTMALRLSHLFSIILWLSLFLLFFHGWFSFNTNNTSIHTLSNRKALSSKIDFTAFLRHRQQKHHRHSHVPVQPGPVGTEIDPRYGVEKRLVPTGPNPLHH
jgi:hypothetical protein